MDSESDVTPVDTLPILDRSGALERVGGDADLLDELLTMLLEQARTGLADLAQAIREGDARGVERGAHSLKGAAASLGAERFRQRAWELEIIGRSGDLGAAPAALERLAAEERVLRSAIAAQAK